MKFNRENRGCRFIFPPFLFFSRSVIYLFHSMSPEVPRPFITNTNSNSFFSVLLRGPVQYIYIFLDKIWCIRVRVLFRRWIARFSRGTWIISNEIRSTEYIFFFHSLVKFMPWILYKYMRKYTHVENNYTDGKNLGLVEICSSLCFQGWWNWNRSNTSNFIGACINSCEIYSNDSYIRGCYIYKYIYICVERIICNYPIIRKMKISKFAIWNKIKTKIKSSTKRDNIL